MARAAGVAAVLFGLVTIAAGARVLAGADPGYVVFRPLLVFNTVMGAAYVLAGVGIWMNARWGTHAAGAIFAVNAAVLVLVISLYINGDAVAIDSARAMAFRTAAWLALVVVLLRIRT